MKHNLLIILAILTSNVFAQIPTSGLVAYYPFNGNANDASGNGHNGTVNGATLMNDRLAAPNSAYYFLNNSISINSWSGLDFNNTTNVSISFWMKTNVINEQRVYSKRGGAGYAGIEIVIISGTIMPFYGDVFNNFVWSQTCVAQLNDNVWHNVVVIFDRTLNVMYTYVDGQYQNIQIDISSVTGSINNNSNPFIGSNPVSATSFSNAGFDDIAIWNRVLTASEVLQIYNGCTIAPVASISSYGSTTFCTGDNVYLVASPSAQVTYQWQKNNVNISGARSKTYTAKTTGAYRCIVTNPCGTSTSSAISVTALPLATVTISATTATTFCAGGSVTFTGNNPGAGYTYQWYKGNVSINGATGLSYTANNPGSYKMVNTNTANACSRISNAKSVVVNCRIANPNRFVGTAQIDNDFLTVYPNPTSSSFTLELNDQENTQGKANIEIFNSLGQQVFKTDADMNEGYLERVIDLQKLDGLNIVKVTVNGKTYNSKIMVD